VGEEATDLFEGLKKKDEGKESRKRGWRLQGVKMFKRHFYEQAVKCFQHAEDEKLVMRARAYMVADQASKLQSEGDGYYYKLIASSKASRNEKRALRQQMKQILTSAKAKFKEAAKQFLQIGLKKQAAQCFYTAEQYYDAAALFEEIEYYA